MDGLYILIWAISSPKGGIVFWEYWFSVIRQNSPVCAPQYRLKDGSKLFNIIHILLMLLFDGNYFVFLTMIIIWRIGYHLNSWRRTNGESRPSDGFWSTNNPSIANCFVIVKGRHHGNIKGRWIYLGNIWETGKYLRGEFGKCVLFGQPDRVDFWKCWSNSFLFLKIMK